MGAQHRIGLLDEDLLNLSVKVRLLVAATGLNLVCEIVSPTKFVVRDLSADSYQANNALPQQAMERFIRAAAETSEWRAAIALDNAGLEVTELLKRAFDWPDPDDEDDRNIPPDQLINKMVDKAAVRHKQHVGKVHMTWARTIGLSSRAVQPPGSVCADRPPL